MKPPKKPKGEQAAGPRAPTLDELRYQHADLLELVMNAQKMLDWIEEPNMRGQIESGLARLIAEERHIGEEIRRRMGLGRSGIATIIQFN